MRSLRQKLLVLRTKSLKQRLLKKIERKGCRLSEKEQLQIFRLPPKDAKEMACKYCEKGRFYPKVQLKFFELPPKMAKEVLLKFVKRHRFYLSHEAEVKIFDLPRDIAEDIFYSNWMRRYPWHLRAKRKAKDFGFI